MVEKKNHITLNFYEERNITRQCEMKFQSVHI